MRNLHRNRQKIYIAPRIEGVEDEKGKDVYEQPFEFFENLAPVDSESEVKEYGERHFDMYKSIVPRHKWEKRIKDDDAVYIAISPVGEKVYGSKADYRVESIRFTLNTMTIYFEKKVR